MDRLGERHQRIAGIGPRIEVHQGVLGDAPRDARLVGYDALDAAVRKIRDVVELGYVDTAGRCEAEQQLIAAAGAAFALPLADDLADLEDDLFAVTEHGGVDEVGDRFGVERRVPAGEHDRIVIGSVDCVERDAREVERRQQVGVAELGRERDAEDVERRDGSVRVDRELRDRVVAHDLFHVGEDRVGALGKDPVALVEDLVEDLHALIGQAHLIRVGIHERPAHFGRIPLLDGRVELAADVLDRLADSGKQRLQAREKRLDSHASRVTA